MGLSYSGLATLYSCPTKWLLQKLNAVDRDDTIHTVFGKSFGEGVQAILMGESMGQAIWKMLLNWTLPLDEVVKEKGFYQAVHGVGIFKEIWEHTLSVKYELATFEDKPACELGAKIMLPGGYHYVIYIDAVLKDKETGELVVFELKTTGARYVDEATYRNSNQALGYGVVLDKIAQDSGSDKSSYTVLYLIYQTFNQSFQMLPFPKSFNARARFLKDLIMDVQWLEFMKEQQHFKRDGKGCKGFGSTCSAYGLCELELDSLVPEATLETLQSPPKDITHVYSFEELINSQLEIAGG